MTDKPQPNAANQWLIDFEEVIETMWLNAIADTVLEMFERDGNVTKETLRDEIVRHISDDNRSRLERATYHGALKAIDGNPPS